MRHQQYHRRTHPYTVVLLYPKHATGDFGADIKMVLVEAVNGESATKKAQREASSDCNYSGCVKVRAEDFRMILVLEGDVSCVGDATNGWGL